MHRPREVTVLKGLSTISTTTPNGELFSHPPTDRPEDGNERSKDRPNSYDNLFSEASDAQNATPVTPRAAPRTPFD